MDPEFVRWMTGIKPGEPYDPDTLKRARERLQRLGVFSSVSVVEAEVVGADGILPVTFNLSERKRRVIGGGASYSTLDGATLEAYWMHRNLFGHAESLRFDASVSRIGAQDLGGLELCAGDDLQAAGRLHARHRSDAAGRGKARVRRTPMRAAPSTPRPASSTSSARS